MGTCASQDETVLLKPSSSSSPNRASIQDAKGRGNGNSTQDSSVIMEGKPAKVSLSYARKQSYDTTTAGTTASKSNIMNGRQGGDDSLTNKKRVSLDTSNHIPQTISRTFITSSSSTTTADDPECAPPILASTRTPPRIIHTPNRTYWASLIRSHYNHILDPADVIFVLDQRVCHMIEKLTPAEVSFVQRRVRSVVQTLVHVQEKDMTQPQVRSKMIYNEYGKLDEFAMSKIFSAGYSRSTNGRRWWYGGQDEMKINHDTNYTTNSMLMGEGDNVHDDTFECIWQRSWKEFDSRRERRHRSNTTHQNQEGMDIQPTIVVHNESTNSQNDCPSDEEGQVPCRDIPSNSSSTSSSYGSLDHNTRFLIQSHATYFPDPITSAYRILTCLSESRWNYVAQTAQISAQQSGLILDVNKKVIMSLDETSDLLEKIRKEGDGILPPPLYPGQTESIDFYRMDIESKIKIPPATLPTPPGISMKEITFLVALALRGSRIQRLTLLFYLMLPMEELNHVLESHPTSGVPTWLLELDSDIIFSLESLSHYYYFGGPPPIRTKQDSLDDPLSVKDACNQLRVDAISVIQVISGLLYVEDSELLESEDLSNIPVGFPEPSLNVIPTLTKPKVGDRRRFISYDYSKYQSAKIYATMTKFLSQGINHMNDSDFDDVTEREQKLSYLDTFWNASETYCTVNKYEKEQDTVLQHAVWTLDEFLLWADKALLDEGSLDLIFGSLFGTGIIPTPSMERLIVRRSWIDWQREHYDMISNQKDHTIEGNLSFWPIQNESNKNGNHDDHLIPKYMTWGGISGVDGGGPLGFGVMYCVEKGWWDRWTAYVNWALLNPAKVSHRPQDLSMEKLLDFSAESRMKSHGSYKCMKKDLKKNVDFILVPPAVWDILFELYGGGPPMPRFILPFSYDPSILDEEWILPKNEDEEVDSTLMLPLFPSIEVETHPWLLSCHLCDPKQPYRRGVSGSQSIQIMAHPNEPMWRLFSEIIIRLKIYNPKGRNDTGQGHARLWKRATTDLEHQQVDAKSGDPWELIFKNQCTTFPYHDSMRSMQTSKLKEFIVDLDKYSNGETVSSAGLRNGSQLMLEYALFTEKNITYWPRHAAAKADKAKKITDEDELFRLKLRGLDINNQLIDPKSLIGLTVDAMDDSGCWYSAVVNRLLMKGGKEMDELRLGYPPRLYEEVASVYVRFSHSSSRAAWIDVESDKIAIVERFSTRANDDIDNDQDSEDVDGKLKSKRNGGALLSAKSNNPKVQCTLPYFGACALTNLGNTCYINVSIQCISYLPFLRSYIVSNQFMKNGDINRCNPLGSGGIIVDALSELLQVMWKGKQGVIAPKEFRSQLVKVRNQYASSNQQDAQEFLSDLLDSLHEDCNKILSKPIVEPLHDNWVKVNSLKTVGEAAWYRFLRRNYSFITDVAMGQALNIVTCPDCGFSSRNFDPFSILSLPVPLSDEETSPNSDPPQSRDSVSIASCLDEFCQEQRLDSSQSWRCPICNDFREGIQKMTLWKLPDILILHLKRFNCSGEEREKLTTNVTVPLTSLDMSLWCHRGLSLEAEPVESYIYDLIGVIDHYGTMTGGHYIALCKATGCAPDGSEEVSHSFSGASVYPFDSLEGYSPDQNESWKRWFVSNKGKESLQEQALAAMQASKAVAESCEPTWLRFDDDVVEQISPHDVVSEKAYVLFLRRRRISPSNMAKYSTIT